MKKFNITIQFRKCSTNILKKGYIIDKRRMRIDEYMETKKYTDREKMIMDMEYYLITSFIKLRKEASISQEQLANETNVIRTTIARIENNMNSPQLKTMLELLEPLGYTLDIVPLKKK